MDKNKQSTKKITYILVSVLAIVGITLSVPGLIGEAANVSMANKKSETIAEVDKTKIEAAETNNKAVTEPFTGEKVDSVEKKIMMSEMEWGSDITDPEVDNENEETVDEDALNQDDSEDELEESTSPIQDNPGGDYSEPTGPENGHIHEFGDWVTMVNPTCTEDGSQSRFCSCGNVETVSIPATGHYWEEHVETIIETHCNGCGYNFGSNPSTDEVNYHTMYDENGNPRDAEGQALHSPVSAEKERRYRVCTVCGITEELQ